MNSVSMKTILRCAAGCALGFWLSGGLAAAASLRIAWDPPPDAWTAGYHVYRSETRGGPYLRLTATPVPEAEYSDETARPGHSYYYVITTMGQEGKESAYSSELEAVLARYDAAPEPGALIVRAAAERRVYAGEMVVLTGSHLDPEGGSISRLWTQVSGPPVSLSGADREEAAFIAPAVSADTVLMFGCTAVDAAGGNATDFVRVTVRRR